MVKEKEISEIEYCQELFKQWDRKQKDEDSFDLGINLGLKIAQMLLYNNTDNEKLRKIYEELFGIEKNGDFTSKLKELYNLKTKVKKLSDN